MGTVARCLPLALAVSLAPACAPVPANAPNGTKLAEAAGFAAAAGVAEVVQAIAEERARNDAPVTHAGGGVSASCDTSNGQYACLSVSDGTQAERPPEVEMTDEQARDFVRDYVNGVRKLNGVPPVVRDPTLDGFAQDGSEELAVDHQPGLHLAAHASELGAHAVEVQGTPDGASGTMVQDVLGALLVASMDEAPGGARRQKILGAGWRKLGVGIARLRGRTYVTVDLSE